MCEVRTDLDKPCLNTEAQRLTQEGKTTNDERHDMQDELNANEHERDAITSESERQSTNVQSPEISEAMRSRVESVVEKKRRDGKPIGVKEKEPRMTAKMRCFASCVAQGMSAREAYVKAYDTSRMSDASVIAEANKLMRDPRISKLMEGVWEAVEQNIIDDAIATRRKIMGDLIKHADDTKARLSDRLKSLELMGRAIGMFTDKTETKTEVVDAEQLKRELDEHVNKFMTIRKAVH